MARSGKPTKPSTAKEKASGASSAAKSSDSVEKAEIQPAKGKTPANQNTVGKITPKTQKKDYDWDEELRKAQAADSPKTLGEHLPMYP